MLPRFTHHAMQRHAHRRHPFHAGNACHAAAAPLTWARGIAPFFAQHAFSASILGHLHGRTCAASLHTPTTCAGAHAPPGRTLNAHATAARGLYTAFTHRPPTFFRRFVYHTVPWRYIPAGITLLTRRIFLPVRQPAGASILMPGAGWTTRMHDVCHAVSGLRCTVCGILRTGLAV